MPRTWLKVDLPHKIEQARFLAASEDAEALATTIKFDPERAVTELTVLAPDHPWLLSIIAGACAMAGANIVDAQSTDHRRAGGRHDFAQSRIRPRRRRRAPCLPHCRCHREGPNRAIASARTGRQESGREGPHSRLRAGANHEHQQSLVKPLYHGRAHRNGSPRPLVELTASLSKLNLNIAWRMSRHSATHGRRLLRDRPARCADYFGHRQAAGSNAHSFSLFVSGDVKRAAG